MKNSIYKYPLEITDRQSVVMPAGAIVLTAQFQGPTLCLWAAVDNSEPALLPRVIRIIGTGHPVSDMDDLEYIATAQQHGGQLVWHVFSE